MRQTFPPMSTKFEIHRRRQVPFIAYQNTSILPLYVLGKRIDVPSGNVEFNERKVDWHDERSLGNLFWLHTAQPMMISWGKEHCGLLSLFNFSK